MTSIPGDPTPRTMMTEIGGWKLGKTLGRGAYAHVRLATHRSGHTAACKILPALHRGQKYDRDQKMDAIEAHKELVLLKGMAGANVPGVVGLEGVMSHQGWNYIFLSLYPKSASSVNFHDRNILVPFFRRVCYAVAGLHALEISHEDLKRSNILVTHRMEPILADFGFSHLSPDHAPVKSLGGTADYSSPEKTRDENSYNGAANDVWSLGILLVKLLGRAHPYAYKDTLQPGVDWKVRMIHGAEPRWDFDDDEREYNGVGYLVSRMLDPDPNNRYTIKRALNHPWLRTHQEEPPHFPRVSKTIAHGAHIAIDVLIDIAFLAFNMGQFHLCETLTVIEEGITFQGVPWMVKWANMLGKWRQKAETMWEDVPTPRSKSPRSPMLKKNEVTEKSRQSLRPLKLIQLSPNAKTRTPVRHATAKSVSKDTEADQPLATTVYRKTADLFADAKRQAGDKENDAPRKARSGVVVRASGAMDSYQASPIRFGTAHRKTSVLRPKKGTRALVTSTGLFDEVDIALPPATTALSSAVPDLSLLAPIGNDVSEPATASTSTAAYETPEETWQDIEHIDVRNAGRVTRSKSVVNNPAFAHSGTTAADPHWSGIPAAAVGPSSSAQLDSGIDVWQELQAGLVPGAGKIDAEKSVTDAVRRSARTAGGMTAALVTPIKKKANKENVPPLGEPLVDHVARRGKTANAPTRRSSRLR